MSGISFTRRRVLGGGIAAGSLLFIPLPYAWVWAQSEGTMKLLRAPKVALVLGNSKYKEAPLKNPANDAKAIGDALRASGFEVTLKMDAGKADMAAAVQAYVQTLAAKKCVGLFYYAGHGIQLAWRNYMLPVDADIDTIGDIQKQGVEVNSLLDGLTKAANPMNVIILDACRDNPFGNLKGVDHKGLSQMDAPQSTILAYATSPGNVASDGDGANGLYTENLLRELKVPEAKVEDVFKRVRLAVRVKSNGAQIPWESTSLEDDFWFIPPKNLQAPSEAEKDKQFEEELALWEKIKLSMTPAPLEEFLRRFPSGQFSELAQLRLDEVLAKQGEKRIQIASAAGNPFTQGYVPADTNFKTGDSYGYVSLNRETRAEIRRYSTTVTGITEGEVLFNNGTFILDRLGNTVKMPDGKRFTPRQDSPIEYAIGKKWSTRFGIIGPSGRADETEFEFRIARRENITVPAGTFDCFVIEGEGYTKLPGGRVELKLNRWVAPDKVRRPIVTEQYRKLQRMGPKPGAEGFAGMGPGGGGGDFAGKGPGGGGGFGGKGPGGFGMKGGGFGKGPGGGDFGGKGPGGPGAMGGGAGMGPGGAGGPG
ncbi:MAG: caspase family protein [Betaproteobacteria bacterium]|nr:caspase family protein [Betaproteobacteria bacterium]